MMRKSRVLSMSDLEQKERSAQALYDLTCSRRFPSLRTTTIRCVDRETF